MPEWICQIVTHLGCGKCKRQLMPGDLSAVGIKRPDSPAQRSSVFYAIFECPLCSKRYATETTGLEFEDLVEAAGELDEIIFRDSQEMTGPNNPFLPTEKPPPTGTDGPAKPRGQAEPSDSKARRPSKLPKHPKDAISEREVQTFLRLLARTSMRVGSKSLKRLLARLQRR